MRLLYTCIVYCLVNVTHALLPQVTVFVILAFLVLAIQVEILAAKLRLNQQMPGKRIKVMSHESGKSLPRKRTHKREKLF